MNNNGVELKIKSSFEPLKTDVNQVNNQLNEMRYRIQALGNASGVNMLNKQIKQTVRIVQDANTGKISAKVLTTAKDIKTADNKTKQWNKTLRATGNTGVSELKKIGGTLSSIVNLLSRMNRFSLTSFANDITSTILSFKSGLSITEDLIGKSAEYVENLNLMQVAFKETGKAGDTFNESMVNGLADVFGLDESQMTRQLGFYRQLGNSLNVDSKYADLLAHNLLKLQLDMASLYNLSFERSGEVLQASMAGQTKPIRSSTGGDITQKTLEQSDLDRLGIDRAISDLNRAEKSILIYLSLERQLKESNGDLAKTINSTANQQKIFSEQCNRVGRAIGNVLTPAFDLILPRINGFLMVMTEIINMLATFVGFELPEYDVNESGLGGYSDALDGITDSAGKTEKALKGLRSFDKLNNITTPTSSGGSSGGTGGGAGGFGTVDPRLLKALKDYDLGLNDIHNNATKIRDRIMEWLGFTKEVNEKTQEVTWHYQYIGKSAEELAELYGTKLAGSLQRAIEKIPFEKYGKQIAEGLNVMTTFAVSFLENFDASQIGDKLSLFVDSFIDEFDGWMTGIAIGDMLNFPIDILSGFLTKLESFKLGDKIGQVISNALSKFDTKKLGATLMQTLNSVIDVLTGIFSHKEIADAWVHDIEDLISGIAQNIDGSRVANLLNKLFDFIVEGFNTAKDSGLLDTLLSTLWDFITDLIAGIDWIKAIATIGSIIYTVITNTGPVLIAKILNWLKNKLLNLANEIGKDIKEWLTTKANELVTRIQNEFENLKKIITDKVKEIITSITNKIKENKVYQELVKVKDKMVNAFNDLKSKAVSKFNEIKSGIQSALSPIYDWVKKNVIDKVVNGFNNMKTKMVDAFKGLKTSIAPILNEIIKAFNKLFKGLNKFQITIPAWVNELGGKGYKESKFGLNIPEIPLIKYKQGGFPEDGWFRASKGEYFGQFDDGTSYIANNKQITDGIRQATMNGMMDAFAMHDSMGNGNKTNVTIIAEDDGILSGIKFKEKDRDRQYGF